VLVAERDAESRETLCEWLESWGYKPIEVSDGEAALQVLSGDGAPQLALLDWAMPGCDGQDICAWMRAKGEAEIYILWLVDETERSGVVEGLKTGADDYALRPLHGHQLKQQLRMGRSLVDLWRELAEAREALCLQADRDLLTGIWNRRRIMRFLDKGFLSMRSNGTEVATIMLDLDHFRRLNDTQGHAAGDAVLRTVARRISEILRPYDGIGRYGGEQFVVVLPDCDAHSASFVAERLRRAIGEAPVRIPGGRVSITASIGLMTTGAEMGIDAERALAIADDCLSLAKERGRNRVVTYGDPAPELDRGRAA